jgi:hypothetical protein
MKKVLGLLAGTGLLCAVPVSLQLSQQGELSFSLDQASARVGRPLTPGSVAGVHRRVERRAVRRGYYGAPAGYTVAAAGVATGAAATSAAYYGANGTLAGGEYRVWNGSNAVAYYPTHDIYAHNYHSGSYYGPVCDPRVDRGCQ